MSYTRCPRWREAISETTKRRRLTVEEKLRILEEARQPGLQIAELCRRHGIGTSQFYGWREQAPRGARRP
ncbi:MAG: transposase [Candidatus Methylomirabilales bacterium]